MLIKEPKGTVVFANAKILILKLITTVIDV